MEAVVEFNRFTFILFLQDTSNVGSSSGWTDEKHKLYITFLEQSLVNQLYSSNGEINSAESFYGTPGAWQNTYSGDGTNTKYDQVVATKFLLLYINILIKGCFVLCMKFFSFSLFNKTSGTGILGDGRG